MISGRRQPDCRLSRRQRLTQRRQFEQVYAQQRRFAGRFMVLWCGSGEGAALRLGVVASRRVGPAVQRNRAKRRLREVFRLNRPHFRGPVDVVLVARPAIVNAAWQAVVGEMTALAAQAGLLAQAGNASGT